MIALAVMVNGKRALLLKIDPNTTLAAVRAHPELKDGLERIEKAGGELGFRSNEDELIAREFEAQNTIATCLRDGKIYLTTGMVASVLSNVAKHWFI